MKKKYLIVYLITIIIASALLFPVTAHSQDLTEVQKQERCQNNKNKLAELEKQSANVNAELRKIPEEKEIEDARGYMVFVRNIGNKAEYNFDEISDADLTKISRIARIYNVTPTDFQEAKRFGWLPSTKALYNVIVKKINKDEALLSQKPALLKQKADIDKQIATHRNNLVALRCDEPADKEKTVDINGRWTYATEWVYTITQNGSNFTWYLAKIKQNAKGTINGKSVSATWFYQDGSVNGSATGTIISDASGRAIQIDWSNGVVFKRD